MEIRSKTKASYSLLWKPVFFGMFFGLFLNSARAQDAVSNSRPAQIAFTLAGLGSNDLIRFTPLEGGASYNEGEFTAFGISAIKPLKWGGALEIGLELSRHKLLLIPNVPPGSGMNPSPVEISVLDFPALLRIPFLKALFINAGPIMHLDVSSDMKADSQTGIGAAAGLGVQLNFDFGMSVFLNPYFKIRSLVPFSGETYPQRLAESGLRLGIGLDLGRK